MIRYIKVAIAGCIFVSSAAFADADDWGRYPAYVQNYGYAPVVQNEFIATPQGIVEQEIVYIPQRVVEYQPTPPGYVPPAANYYGYAQPVPVYVGRDWDER
ncbi:MAG: hypothetical protein PHW13_09445 [Methylococcales bacterium]|nr:hypothetical protein [Methylococcales bacterium]